MAAPQPRRPLSLVFGDKGQQMGVIACPYCGRLNLDDELRTAGFICELCGKKIPQGNAASQEPEPGTTRQVLEEEAAVIPSPLDDGAFQAGPSPPRRHEPQAAPEIELEPRRTSAGAGWTPLLVTALLLAAMIGGDIVTRSSLPGLMIVAATALWAAIDSSKLELHKYKGGTRGAFLVFLGVVLLWVFFFPLYMVVRAQLLSGELKLKQKYRSELRPEYAGARDPAPPTARPGSETDQGIKETAPPPDRERKRGHSR